MMVDVILESLVDVIVDATTSVVIDSMIDSLKVLAVVFIVNILLSFFENKLSHVFSHHEKASPLIGASMGLIPQCGISVVSADLYIKNHISLGTIIAIFISCSDEALPILLSSSDKAIMVIPLILIKFVLGFTVGYIVDLIYRNNKKIVDDHMKDCHHEEEIHVGCCGHNIDNMNEPMIKKHFIHPLIHSIKIFVYVFIINVIFGLIIYFVGIDTFKEFLLQNKYFTPLFATLIGLIPNCASSVLVTELYLIDGVSFATLVAGLITNAGLGIVILLKNKNMVKKTFIIMGIMVLIALISSYTIGLIFGF